MQGSSLALRPGAHHFAPSPPLSLPRVRSLSSVLTSTLFSCLLPLRPTFAPLPLSSYVRTYVYVRAPPPHPPPAPNAPPLTVPVYIQMTDLRSQIVREACRVFELFATTFNDGWRALANRIVPDLVEVTGSANKVRRRTDNFWGEETGCCPSTEAEAGIQW